MIRTFSHPHPFSLELGQQLPAIEVAYQVWGENPDHPVIWICHALTANSDAFDWWQGLVGEGKLIDPARYQIVCANMLGSCYGSTYALHENPATGIPYYDRFPHLTNRDIALGFDLLREHLGINKVYCLIGGSLGGQQLLEWAILRPQVFEKIVPIATNARHSPWGIAFNESQRMAIAADSSWGEHDPEAGLQGMEVARSIALLSYRNYQTYLTTQLEADDEKVSDFRATTYQRYQGKKLRKRFDAFAYWTLSRAMDSQHLGRGRSSVQQALHLIQANTLVVGVNSDLLFPVSEQQFLAEHIPRARYQEIHSLYGHDGFLLEFEQLEQILQPFLES
ncbi:MAG: homoserine O-acetyltransferase [Bacteroidota bacterium]